MSISNLKKERGIFSYIGEEWFDDYWTAHGTQFVKDGKTVTFKNLKEYLIYRNREDLWEVIVKAREKEKLEP
jgi:hypothetical protein